MTTKLIKKLKNAYQVCKACGSKYGVYSVGCSSSWIGKCDVCGLENVSVTEARDYGYLITGIRKLSMEETSTTETPEVKYTSKITQITIQRGDDFETTTVSIDDEGGGAFIVLNTNDGEIRLDFDEFDEVIKAVSLLKNQ